MKPDDAQPAAAARVRFDKWLWAARFYKTRSLAAQAIDAGQARVNGERVKPAHAPRVGDSVAVRKAGLVWTVEVLALSDRRGGAPEAALLYRETEASAAARAEAAAAAPGGARRQSAVSGPADQAPAPQARGLPERTLTQAASSPAPRQHRRMFDSSSRNSGWR